MLHNEGLRCLYSISNLVDQLQHMPGMGQQLVCCRALQQLKVSWSISASQDPQLKTILLGSDIAAMQKLLKQAYQVS